MADAPKDLVYKCNMYNPHLDVMMGGSYSRLKVRPSTSKYLKYSGTYFHVVWIRLCYCAKNSQLHKIDSIWSSTLV